MSKSTARQKRRNENYNILRKAGYNSYESNAYKDLARSKVAELVNLKRQLNEDVIKVRKGVNRND